MAPFRTILLFQQNKGPPFRKKNEKKNKVLLVLLLYRAWLMMYLVCLFQLAR